MSEYRRISKSESSCYGSHATRACAPLLALTRRILVSGLWFQLEWLLIASLNIPLTTIPLTGWTLPKTHTVTLLTLLKQLHHKPEVYILSLLTIITLYRTA